MPMDIEILNKVILKANHKFGKEFKIRIINRVIKAQFQAVVDTIECGEFKTVKLPALGKFIPGGRKMFYKMNGINQRVNKNNGRTKKVIEFNEEEDGK